jgi:hypothetical protein
LPPISKHNNVIMQNLIQTPPLLHLSQDQTAEVSPANPKVNWAIAQSRPSGILFASANGKLYFEFLKSISVPQNHLPHKGEVRYSEVMRPIQSFYVFSGS